MGRGRARAFFRHAVPHIEKMTDFTDRAPVARAASLKSNAAAFTMAAPGFAEGTCVPLASAMAEEFTDYTRHVCMPPRGA